MHYIVDGYNLIFRLLYSSSPLQEQRAKIIKDISEKAKLLKLNITIVFDSSFQTGESTRTHINDVEIIYTAQYESADDFIINLLKHKDKNNTVITSDQRLAWRARRQNAHSETVEDFIRWLNKRYQNKKLNPQPKTTPAPEAVAKPPPAPSPPPKAKPGITAEDSFDYYLQSFDTQSDHTAPKPKKPPPQKRTHTPNKRIVETENDRWLRLFEDQD